MSPLTNCGFFLRHVKNKETLPVTCIVHPETARDPIALYDEIEALKVREDATILAHYYQDGEIQELADFTGDSLKLAAWPPRSRARRSFFAGCTSWPRRPRC